MKKAFSLSALLVMAALATPALAAESANPLKSAADTATTNLKAGTAKAACGELVVGTIKSLDAKAGTITLNDQIITVKAETLATLKPGDKVKVTLAPGTLEARRIVVLSKAAAKQKVQEQKEKAKTKAIDLGTQKVLEKMGGSSAQ
ncbi:MAG: hypothetical protein BWY87_01148 [Deltaproteobacteria bacterium ADurb.Bin510]|nr:MAG: hypothetical protein BWY87_01148 [Deltaproteobacteria bacterium ADurb.Bin510]